MATVPLKKLLLWQNKIHPHRHTISMVKKFLMCGLTGWCMEVFWTGLGSAIKKDKKLTSVTSIWMFPIYGIAVIIEPISRHLRNKKIPSATRGLIFAVMIFATEYATVSLLKKSECCPWDYSKAKLNIKGIIRLDYLPVWFAAGLIYEKIFNSTKITKKP